MNIIILGIGLVNSKMLFKLNAVYNALGLEIELNFRSRLKPGKRERVKSEMQRAKPCCFASIMSATAE